MPSDKSFERPCGIGGPRLPAAEVSLSAAQFIAMCRCRCGHSMIEDK